MIGTILTRQAIKSAFHALNQGDLKKFMKAWDENIYFYYPGKVRAGGLYKGKSQVKDWFEKFILQFPQRKFTIKQIGVDNLFDLTGTNTVFAYLDLELINKDGFVATNQAVSVIKLRNTKVVSVVDYLKTTDGFEYKKGWGEI